LANGIQNAGIPGTVCIPGPANIEVTPKRLEILHELLPTANLFALLVNPSNPYAEILSRNVQAAATTLGLELKMLHASTEHDFDAVFSNLVRLRSGGLVIGGGEVFLDSRHGQLAALALRHSIPTIYQGRDFALSGGLMSYGGSTLDSYRVAGLYVGRILKGEKPAEMPVPATHQVRAGHQRPDGADARPYRAAGGARARRRGD
jgi:ABC-type uncharacterized transport system substrate-binding protein